MFESIIEQIIATHFCSDQAKQLSFMSLIFKDGEITLSTKIRMLRKLLRQCYPDLYGEVSPLIRRLDKTRELRNKFAHSELVFEGQEVMLRYYKDGRIVTEPTKTEENFSITLHTVGCLYILEYLKDEICNRVTGKGDGLIRHELEAIKDHWPRLLARPTES